MTDEESTALATVRSEGDGLHTGSLVDADGRRVLSWSGVKLAGSGSIRMEVVDHVDRVVGRLLRDPELHQVRDHWSVLDAEDHKVLTLDERGPVRSLLAGFNQPVPRRYELRRAGETDVIGEAKRALTSRRWDVSVDRVADPHVSGCVVTTLFCVLALDQLG
ncbi:MAG: hypothetical protein R2705_06705 [Ilumatobacteraceae bacterium]